MTKLSIIIPFFNESATLQQLLQKVVSVQLPDSMEKEMILVNDGSAEASNSIVSDFVNSYKDIDIKCITHSVNRGKGAAVRSGIAQATGKYIIIQDADLELDPTDYNLLLQPLLNDEADVVYGSRFSRMDQSSFQKRKQYKANKFLTKLSNKFTGLNLTDMETCYKLTRTELIRSISLEENRFGFEPEITAKLSQIPGIRFCEIPVSFTPRSWNAGKKIRWYDGFRAIYCIVKYNLFKC